MRKYHIILAILLLTSAFTLPTIAKQEAKKIPFIEFKQAEVKDAVGLLADISNVNIAATQEAGQYSVTFRMKDTSIKGIIDTMARVSGLWYRYIRATDSYLLMTAAQYQNDIVVFRDDIVRTFQLRHQNVEATAKTIRNLYGERIVLTLEQNTDDFIGLPFEEVEDATVASNSSLSSGTSSSSNSSTNNSNNSSNSSNNRNSNNNNQNNSTNNQQNISRGENGQVSGEQLSTLGNYAIEGQRRNQSILTTGQLNSLQGKQRIDDQQVAKVTDTQTPVYVTINKIHNLLFIRTTDETVIDEIEELIDASDKPTPQVLLEMEIIEVSVGDSYNQEFDLGFSSAGKVDGLTITSTADDAANTSPDGIVTEALGLDLSTETSANVALSLASILRGETVKTLSFGATGGVYNVINDNVNASIEVLKENGQARTLSKPVVLASNNRQAKIFLGDEQIIATGIENLGKVQEFDADGNVRATTTETTTVTTERRKVGNTLYLLPSINADRTVTIDILQDQAKVVSDGAQLPYYDSSDDSIRTQAIDSVNQTNIKTVVVAKDGLTIALGGMVSSTTSLVTSKVPVLGDIPFLGAMFTNEKEVNKAYQYIMLITPHIIMTPEESADKSRKVTGFDYNKNANYKGENSFPDYGFESYVDMTKFAFNAIKNNTLTSEIQGFKPLPLTNKTASAIFPLHGISARVKALWQQENLYVSAFEIRNHTPFEQILSAEKLHGDWLSATFAAESINAFSQQGDSTWLYLVSDEPFQKIVEAID